MSAELTPRQVTNILAWRINDHLNRHPARRFTPRALRKTLIPVTSRPDHWQTEIAMTLELLELRRMVHLRRQPSFVASASPIPAPFYPRLPAAMVAAAVLASSCASYAPDKSAAGAGGVQPYHTDGYRPVRIETAENTAGLWRYCRPGECEALTPKSPRVARRGAPAFPTYNGQPDEVARPQAPAAAAAAPLPLPIPAALPAVAHSKSAVQVPTPGFLPARPKAETLPAAPAPVAAAIPNPGIEVTRVNLHYALGGAILDPTAAAEVLRLASSGEIKGLSLVARSDSFGSAEGNQVVARRRAEGVRTLLVAAGIDPDIIEVTLVPGKDVEPDKAYTPLNSPIGKTGRFRRVELVAIT